MLENLTPDKTAVYNRVVNALVKNLSPVFLPDTPQNAFNGKMETFLTCRKVSEFFKNNLPDKNFGRLFEELSLQGVYRTLGADMEVADVRLLLSELPRILPLDYKIVRQIRYACIAIIPRLMELMKNVPWSYNPMLWADYVRLGELLELLKSFDAYDKN